MTAAVDDFKGQKTGEFVPTRAAAVTPSDTVDLSDVTLAIYVGGAGDVTLITAAGDTVTFKAVPVGTTLRVRASRVKATATTATLMLAMW